MPAEQLHFIMPCSLIKRYSFVIFAFFDFLFVNCKLAIDVSYKYYVVSSLDNITHIVHIDKSNAIWTMHQNFVIESKYTHNVTLISLLS